MRHTIELAACRVAGSVVTLCGLQRSPTFQHLANAHSLCCGAQSNRMRRLPFKNAVACTMIVARWLNGMNRPVK